MSYPIPACPSDWPARATATFWIEIPLAPTGSKRPRLSIERRGSRYFQRSRGVEYWLPIDGYQCSTATTSSAKRYCCRLLQGLLVWFVFLLVCFLRLFCLR